MKKLKKLKKQKLNKGLIVLGIIIFLTGLFIGYMLGVYTTIKAFVEVGSKFITIDYHTVEQALFQYKNNIGSCIQNASIHSN